MSHSKKKCWEFLDFQYNAATLNLLSPSFFLIFVSKEVHSGLLVFLHFLFSLLLKNVENTVGRLALKALIF